MMANREVPCCAYCAYFLKVFNLDEKGLKALNSKTLRHYLEAYNIDTHGLLEKDEFIKTILANRPLSDSCENHFWAQMPDTVEEWVGLRDEFTSVTAPPAMSEGSYLDRFFTKLRAGDPAAKSKTSTTKSQQPQPQPQPTSEPPPRPRPPPPSQSHHPYQQTPKPQGSPADAQMGARPGSGPKAYPQMPTSGGSKAFPQMPTPPSSGESSAYPQMSTPPLTGSTAYPQMPTPPHAGSYW
ncbi:hypothetical protein BGZ65_011563, partial [Modicella reniformis]